MPQESSSNENSKSKQRFSGRRRNYIDTFRWGFVPEESDDAAPKIEMKLRKESGDRCQESGEPQKKPASKSVSVSKKTSPPVKPTSTDDTDSPSKSKRKRRQKGATEAAATLEPTAKPQPSPSAKGDLVKNSSQTPTGRIPRQSPPAKRPPKSKGRTKVVLPSYVDREYDDDGEDLRLPSYGRTPIPTDDELPVPQKNTRKPNTNNTVNPAKARIQTKEPAQVSSSPRFRGGDVDDIKQLVAESVSSVPSGFRPRREQMVWDPDRQEYVPLDVNEKGDRSQETGEKPESTEKPKPDKTKIRAGGGTPPTSPPPTSPRKTRPETGKSKIMESPPVLPAPKTGGHSPRAHAPDSRRGDVPKFVKSPHPDPADIESEVSGFAELGMSETMLEALRMIQYLEPTPIQAGVFQKVQTGTDLMGQAQTGTGKTAAFMMPIIEGVETCPPGNNPVALVLVPTRELAVQVRDEAMRLAYGRDIHITAIYGGKPIAKQIERLKNGIDIVVGTPGRILDLMNRRALFLDSLRWVVLDEADRMLDIGFRPDIEKILKRTPQDRQTLLFSATLPPPVVRLAEKYMKSPEALDFSNKSVAVETIEQFYITVDAERKFDALVHLLDEQQPQQAIIFTRTKRGADRLARLLSKRLDKLAAIHGDLQQSERDRVMAQFRSGSVKYLVATDVVGRGIDVTSISHIINYDIPKFCDDYVHRVGRTGRMGRDGVAFTFVTAQEGSELTRIEMRIDKLLKRAELKGFESFTKPHDPDASLDDDTQPEPPKPVFGKPQRKVRRAL